MPADAKPVIAKNGLTSALPVVTCNRLGGLKATPDRGALADLVVHALVDDDVNSRLKGAYGERPIPRHDRRGMLIGDD